jgi:hypothetical protein
LSSKVSALSLLKRTLTTNVVEPIRFNNVTGSLPVREVAVAPALVRFSAVVSVIGSAP